MNYCEIKKCDIANGIGVRTVLFVSGCTNRCEGCFQPQTWDFNYGKPFTKETEDEIIESCKPSYVAGLTVLGGEPFEPSNQRALVPFLKRFRRECPGKTVWCFSGFRLDDELLKDGSHPRCEVTDQMLSFIDVLVDGRFILSKRNLTLRFRGSENQRLIDMNETRKSGKIILWDK